MTVQKLVLMVQPVRLQGLIWQAVLKSQQIAVIWESPEANLAENLDQLKTAGLVLPDLLLLDMQSSGLNPYAFCRWSREQYPHTKVVLTNSQQVDISLSERQWAVNQGASDLLPGFRQDNLVSGVAIAVKRILEILDDHPLNNGALISVLLTIKRQLDDNANATARSLQSVPLETAAPNGQVMLATPLTTTPTPSSGQPPARFTADSRSSNGNGNGLKNGTKGKSGSERFEFASANGKAGISHSGGSLLTGDSALSEDETVIEVPRNAIPQNGQPSPSPHSQPKSEAGAEPSDPAHTTQPQRRYRGLYY